MSGKRENERKRVGDLKRVGALEKEDKERAKSCYTTFLPYTVTVPLTLPLLHYHPYTTTLTLTLPPLHYHPYTTTLALPPATLNYTVTARVKLAVQYMTVCLN